MGAKPGGLLVADGLAEIAAASPRDLPRVSLPVLRRVPLFATSPSATCAGWRSS